MQIRVCCPSCGSGDATFTTCGPTGLLFCPRCALVCEPPSCEELGITSVSLTLPGDGVLAIIKNPVRFSDIMPDGMHVRREPRL